MRTDRLSGIGAFRAVASASGPNSKGMEMTGVPTPRSRITHEFRYCLFRDVLPKVATALAVLFGVATVVSIVMFDSLNPAALVLTILCTIWSVAGWGNRALLDELATRAEARTRRSEEP